MSTTETITERPAEVGGIPDSPGKVVYASGPRKEGKWAPLAREASCHATLMIAGWSDATGGPLLPYIQSYFHISYTVVSMIFVGQMVGFVAAGLLCSKLIDRYGLGKVIAMGAIIQAAGYVFLIPAWSFPVMPVCYAILGFGMALQDATSNIYVSTLPNAEWKLGWLHASYGLGALVCPLAATAFASAGHKFSFFYIVSIGLALVNVAVLLYAFRFSYRMDEQVAPALTKEPQTLRNSEVDIELRDLQESDGATTPSSQAPLIQDKRTILHQTLTNRTVLMAAGFSMLYVGSEVSMGGWIVTYLIENRNAGPSAGYVSSAFWGGLMLGRVVLTPVNLWAGERRVVWLYLGIATCLEFAIWFARDFIGNAVTVFLVGLIIGPIYPIIMSVCTKVLPRHLHASGIGFIAAFGQSGSALFPFITGALAQKFSPAVLQPVLIVLFVAQGLVWIGCPKVVRKTE